MKRILLAVLLVGIVLCLFGCGEATFDDLVISAADVTDVPEGEYTLRYSISRYEEFLSSHPDLRLSVVCVDDANNVVEVRNNRVVVVEKGKTYTVSVELLYPDGEQMKSRRKQFVVAAEKIPPEVTFYIGAKKLRSYVLPYGGSMEKTEVDGIIERDFSDLSVYPESGLAEGFNWVLESQKWVVGSLDSDKEFNYSVVTGVKKNVDIYLVRSFRATGIKTITISFDNLGGTETASIVGDYNSSVLMPEVPTRSGYVFDGWYTDAGYLEKFDWTLSSHRVLTKDYRLYARWLTGSLPEVENAFLYEVYSADDEGYPYCLVKKKGDYTGELILPVGYGNVPVRGFVDRAFANCSFASVTIPSSYSKNTYYAFAGCSALERVRFAPGSEMTYLNDGVFCDCTRLSEVQLPDGIHTLGEKAFFGCALENVDLPENLALIRERCFENCVGLSEVAVPDAVYAVQKYAFAGCTALTKLTFSERSGLDTIYAESIENTAITEITLPYFFLQNKLSPFADTDVTVKYHPSPATIAREK